MDPERIAKLGTKWTCHSCGAKFYDLHRNPPVCPKCNQEVDEPAPARPKKKAARRKAG